ncbi:MAG: peptide chain release factor N(5)-glutamine methyltransferase [Muribaculaceae bacterium]|nr:peptide chain release factor N(5)-glutamine methyltransferase [Muribaculaceae bacterium]
MTTQEARTLFRQRLGGLYPPAELDAMLRVVMEEVMHYSPVDVAIRASEQLPAFFPDRLAGIMHRLEQHEPIQYVLGVARFHGHTFRVTPATLIPRPETEQLVDLIVDQWRGQNDLRVMDLGTGCGCIAISLALALSFARVAGVDISHEALAVARDNAAALKARVQWIEADMLEMPPLSPASLDIIVSNPPYITVGEQPDMERNVLDYEPHQALFVPDDDPLRYYRAIASLAATALAQSGRLYLEISQYRGKAVAELLRQAGFDDVVVLKDSFGNDRFATARNNH